jgi:hypothetical protein
MGPFDCTGAYLNAVYYYEIHEGDDELGTQVIVTHERRFTPLEFLRLVKQVRAKVLDVFEEDTLTEAIAGELERAHGFTYVSDDRLTAAVNVSDVEDENYLTATGEQHRSIYLALDEEDRAQR